jgi:NAD(P)-dependent dehydrogenase (short-subunit alcohol dehydrogenase family)
MIGTDLRGKACLVTGSSRGIGAAVARGFGGFGMRVAVHYRGARDEAAQVRADIVDAGGRGDRAAGRCVRARDRRPDWGGGGSSPYAGSKAFVATFSRALAREVATEGIRVNCVAPGVLATPTQDRATPPEILEAVRRQIPQRRSDRPRTRSAPSSGSVPSR